MNQAEILEEMRNLRYECRILNANIIKIAEKNDRLSHSLDSLIQQNNEYTDQIRQMRIELKSYTSYDIEGIKEQIDIKEREIKDFQKEYSILLKDISRLTEALQVQRESALKQEIYGQIATGYKLYSTNQIDKEGTAIALKKSLEDELNNLETIEAPTRVIAKKRSQLSRVHYLCPTT